MNIYFRVKKNAHETNPSMPSYDQERWANLEDYKQPAEVSVNLITALYQRLTVLFKNVSQDEW